MKAGKKESTNECQIGSEEEVQREREKNGARERERDEGGESA